MPDTKIGDILRTDPFARWLAGAAIFAVALCTFAWSGFLAAAALNALVADDVSPAVSNVIDHFLPLLGGLGGDYFSAIVAILPVALAIVCYTTSTRRRLNFWGRSTLLLSLLGALAAAFALAALKTFPAEMTVLGKPSVVVDLSSTSEVAVRTSLFYLAVLLGVKPANEK